VEVLSYNDPTPVSPTDSESYKLLDKSIKETFKGMIVSPFLFIAATDARYYTEICDNVYRFTPFMYSDDDRERIHAINERCNIDDLQKAVQFFIRYIGNTCK
jgi:carboxypeptidase PM20D1